MTDRRRPTTHTYKLHKSAWTQLPDMKHARYSHQCEMVNENLFVFGGYGEQSVEMLRISDTAQDGWRTGPTLTNRFRWGQSVIFKDILYLVDMDGQVVKMVDDKWEEVASIGWNGYRPVFPAPVLSAAMLGC